MKSTSPYILKTIKRFLKHWQTGKLLHSTCCNSPIYMQTLNLIGEIHEFCSSCDKKTWISEYQVALSPERKQTEVKE